MSHSALSVGIVGLPNVGKSTLFNALLKKQQALAANYPFATIEPNVGVVPVPDERLNQLADLVMNEYKSPSTSLRISRPPIVPAVVQFVDIAGLVKGASRGEGLGNQFLSHIREVDAIVQVVRNFEDESIIRSGSIDPKSDVEVVNTELVLADLQMMNKRLESKGTRQKEVGAEELFQVLQKIKSELDSGQLVSQMNLTEEEKFLVKDLNLLTAKPIIYVYNSDEGRVAEFSSTVIARSEATRQSSLEIASGRTPRNDILFVSAKLEAELSVLSDDEQKSYLSELNIKESGLDKVIKKAYAILGLITFLTAGPKEVRAWTLLRGLTALRASGVIHSDFERGFIAAQVCSYEDLISAGSYLKAKELGKIRTEGKEYVIQDGDVVEFRFSV